MTHDYTLLFKKQKKKTEVKKFFHNATSLLTCKHYASSPTPLLCKYILLFMHFYTNT